MHKNTVGLLSGIIAGFIQLVIEQLLFALNISKSDAPGTISKILFGASSTNTVLSWIIYLLTTGFAGWILSIAITKKPNNYIYQGLISGIVLWSLMNIIFMIIGMTPTWAMGLSTCIVTFLSHLLFGIIVVYALFKFQRETD
jgi:hypothetical protein